MNRALPSAQLLQRPSKAPPDDTWRESEYLSELRDAQRPVSIKLLDGEVVRGWIEYYDTNMLRLTREGAPNLFIFKHDIRYISEAPRRGPGAGNR